MLFMHLFLAVLGLCCCTLSLVVVSWGLLSSCSARASHCAVAPLVGKVGEHEL